MNNCRQHGAENGGSTDRIHFIFECIPSVVLIISHKHKFIFFAVPKTATHTIRQALTPHMGEEDWEQQVLFGQDRALPIPEIAALNHGHISVTQIQPHLSDEVWGSYFKFGFVRNPFDRYVSTCFFLHRDTPNFARSAIPFHEAGHH